MSERTIAPKSSARAPAGQGGMLQRQCACGTHTIAGGDCAACGKKKEAATLQRAAINAEPMNEAPPIVNEVLRSPGQPLDESTRAYFEPRFGHDFSRVRVHTDAQATQSAAAVNALAYTVGRDVVFGAGHYAPDSSRGKSLLAHELSHVIQQRSHSISSINHFRLGESESPAERQADEMAKAAASWQTVPQHVQPEAQVMRATRTFFLTFDDGPHAAELGKGINRTEMVLDTLKTKGIGAGFFIQTGVSYRGASKVGKQLVQRMQAEGHKIGIHTGGSKDHELHTEAEKAGRLKDELEAAKTYVKKETGQTPTLVRPPTGKYDKAVEKTYTKVSLTNFLWDMDGDQGKDLSLADLKSRIKSEMTKVQANGWKPTTPSPNIVVLYHDIQKGTATNLADLIDHIKKVTGDISNGQDTAAFTSPTPTSSPAAKPSQTPTKGPAAKPQSTTGEDADEE